MIPRRESILDFKKLEVIKFGSKFVVSPDMIRHCLPRIPKLKQIQLNWNSSLSAPFFRDFVFENCNFGSTLLCG
ncbi:unnamed protein product [Allacma fusca]|uniref:Uncharacterized protein n=2 Tax=Allacma fusca TaxID=39272 RepID=A0A8J2L9A7_9HEXA|nr:unnamed protein product [Allacma fusca]